MPNRNYTVLQSFSLPSFPSLAFLRINTYRFVFYLSLKQVHSALAAQPMRLPKHFHEDIMDTPSDEAVQAYMEYFQRETSTCRFLPFLKHLIYFLVDDFDIKIDANALPTAATEETISEETVRIQVVGRLLDEFKDNFDAFRYGRRRRA
jgi:hypothetical protein